MQCPQDGALLEQEISHTNANNAYACSICGGKFIKSQGETIRHSQIVHDNHSDAYNRFFSGNNLECPFDKDALQQTDEGYICQLCHGIWKPLATAKTHQNQYNVASSVVGQVMGLFIVSVALFAWQLGGFNSSADVISISSKAPLKMTEIFLWTIIFFLIFSIPSLIYYQLIHSHRPHIKKTLSHPFIKWLPIIIIILITINIFYFSP